MGARGDDKMAISTVGLRFMLPHEYTNGGQVTEAPEKLRSARSRSRTVEYNAMEHAVKSKLDANVQQLA